MSDTHPFVRRNFVDKPGTLGAVWWNQSLSDASTLESRRNAAAKVGLAVGLGLLGVGIVGGLATGGGGGDDDEAEELREEQRRGLELQETYGWNFGAPQESLVYDGAEEKPLDRAALRTLAADLAPAQAGLEPFYLSTLFRSPEALPKLKLGPSDPAVPPIAEAMRTRLTPSMKDAFEVGRALAAILREAVEPAALVVDLRGRDGIAFAAGALERFEPVFQFDNWPHPRAVVPSHHALAAAAYYQPLFAKKDARSPKNLPAFVLDRERLSAYRDDAAQFDNRWLAKLPPAATLLGLGAKRVLYVVPGEPTPVDLDDLNEVFTAYERAGLRVHAVSVDAFQRLPPPASGWGYARSATPDAFFADYPLRPGPAKPHGSDLPALSLRAWRPVERSGLFGGSSKAKPSLGLVPVLVGVTTGALAGAKLAGLRSGSILRASGGWGG